MIQQIDKSIQAICKYLDQKNVESGSWKDLNEEILLFELAICIISSQMNFEMAVAMAKHLKDAGCLNQSRFVEHEKFCEFVKGEIAKPVTYISMGKEYTQRPRFANKIPNFLCKTIANIYIISQTSLSNILRTAQSAREVRDTLIKLVVGFGPKQSSMFLRRIGFDQNLAIIDTHILDYLTVKYEGEQIRVNLSSLPQYEEVEKKFAQISKEFGYPMGQVDLATWVTMRVYKKEKRFL